MVKITLTVNGQEKTYTPSELIAILEAHHGTGDYPKEGIPFVVNVDEIKSSRHLFTTERGNIREENLRKLILQALDWVEANPKMYKDSFRTLMPEKTWTSKSMEDLSTLAKSLGGHVANWVDWALQLAQRLVNGESWEVLCTNPDTAQWFIAIIWQDGSTRCVGGALKDNNHLPAAAINEYDVAFLIDFTVPLVVVDA